MKGESGPKPAPEGPAAKPDARSHLSVADGLAVQLQLPELAVERDLGSTHEDPVGFLDKAASGKVRPTPREPQITHYGCTDRCCRSWSA